MLTTLINRIFWGSLLYILRVKTLSSLIAVAILGPVLLGPVAAGEDTARRIETAALMPRVAQTPGSLPRILTPEDAQLYRDIFAQQEEGNIKAADRLIASLQDQRLMGHVLAQRYLHPTAYRSTYKELKAWMADYADHPQAKRIHKLAIKRRPRNHLGPKEPEITDGLLNQEAVNRGGETYQSTKRLGKKGRRSAARLKQDIRRKVLRTRLSAAEKLIAGKSAKRLLDQVERDQATASVAAGWYHYGNDEKAYDLASRAASRSGEHVPIAHWTAGLAAWRMGETEQAAEHFQALASSAKVSDWNLAAGAYWAARANLKLKRPTEMSRWLRIAADYPLTFYGLLAREALGQVTDFVFADRPVNDGAIAAVLQQSGGSRALALLQADQRQRAEEELLRLGPWHDQTIVEGLLAVADGAQMPQLAFKFARYLKDSDRELGSPDSLIAGLYPIPPWQPEEGFLVDRALVYALMRQESGFNPRAKSKDGARGLMQLMPRTASYVAGERFRGNERRRLFDPQLNIDLGQRYVSYLLQHEAVQGDLFRLAAAYNGGPGNLGKWDRKTSYDNDPLLFIESLPSRETRLFIERVLTNLWVYRHRLGQPPASLVALASGEWPSYERLDFGPSEVVQNARN